MTSSDKEFEEQLIEAGNKLLDPPSSVEDLLAVLDKAEYYLSRVEQSPIKTIENALSPWTKALVADKLFKHSDSDVKVAVAACISEVTRITAPDAPYTDEQMKQVFQLIVSSFEQLDDIESRSYTKRTSILETVAKVRSCVVMLDLECDALILEMFQHFLKSIRDQHPKHVFSCMETIMTLVIEESEEISVELLSPILDTLKKDNEGVLPIAKKLGEKVLQNSAAKVKSYLGQALISLGTSVEDYSEVISSIIPDGNAEDKTDVTPAVEHEVENEAASPKSEVSNGLKQTAEDEPLVGAVTVKQPEIVTHRTRLKITGLSSKDKTGKSDTPTDGKKEPGDSVGNGEQKDIKTTTKPRKNSRKHGRKWSSAKKSTKPADTTPMDDKKEPGQPVDNSEDATNNLPGSPQENRPTEADLPLDGGKEVDIAPSSPKDTATELADVSPLKNEDRKKKERSVMESERGNDSKVKENAGLKKSGGGASNEDRTPLKVKISRKRSEITDNPKASSVKPSAEKVKADVDGSSLKSLKVKDKKGPAKREKTHVKDVTISSEKDVDEEAVLRSKSTKKHQRDEEQPAETPKEKGKRTRTPAKKGSRAKGYGEEVVGSKVKVWWPRDKTYYEGVIDSFDSKKKRHKILYTDGEEERLNLSKQRWGIIKEFSSPIEEPNVAEDISQPEKKLAEETHESSPELPLMKLLEMSSNKKLSAKRGRGSSSKKSEAVPPTTDRKPREESKKDTNLETESGGKAKDSSSPNIGSKLVGLARRMTSKPKDGNESKKEDGEAKNEKPKKEPANAPKGRTPRSVSKPKKGKSNGSDKVISSTSKSKSKAKAEDSKDVDEGSVEPAGKVKASSSKLKPKESKEVNSDSEEEPSDAVQSDLPEAKLQTKPKGSKKGSAGEPSDKVKSKPKQNVEPKEGEDVGTDSGEKPSDKVKSSLPKEKEKPEPKESENVAMDSEEELSDKEKSIPSKAKESEDVDMDSGELAEKVKSNSDMKQRESEDVDMIQGEEPSEKVKSSSSKPKENEEVKLDSGEPPSKKVKSGSLKLKQTPKPKKTKEADKPTGRKPSGRGKAKSSKPKAVPEAKEKAAADEDSGEETEDGLPVRKEKKPAEPSKTTASGRRTGKKRQRGD